MKNSLVKLFLSLLAGVFVSGCSTFQRDWRAASKEVPRDSIEGPWAGTWKSDASSHSDKLRCLLRKIGDGKYEARFHAKYKKVLSFKYTALFEGVNTNEVFSFSGKADLGTLAGGVYHYKGEISPRSFFATYNSKYDHGTFTLERPKR